MGHTSNRKIAQVLFATAVAVFMIGTFLSLGGVSYAAARGGSPAGDQYGQPAGVLTPAGQQTGQQGGGVAGGTLPNTGMSLLVTGIAGASLIGAGLLVRRNGRRTKTDNPDQTA